MNSTTKPSAYKGVVRISNETLPDKFVARFTFNKIRESKQFDREIDAAIHYDKMRMDKGLEPLNILTDKPEEKKHKTLNLMYINGVSLFTENRTKINKFVKAGRTILIDCEIEARKITSQKGSSYYSVYNQENKSVGFAIPK